MTLKNSPAWASNKQLTKFFIGSRVKTHVVVFKNSILVLRMTASEV